MVAEAGTAAEAMQCVRTIQFDILVLDLSMPGRSGVDLVRQAKGERPDLPVLVLSMHAEDQYAVRAFAAGASAYITKGSRAEILQQALRRLSQGGRFVDESIAPLLARIPTPGGAKPTHESLSNREFQVLHALVSGESVTAIASRLHLSVKTISTHKSNVMRKLGCPSLAELVRYAIQWQIVAQQPGPSAPMDADGAASESQ